MDKSNILLELEKDVRKNYNGDFFKCKLILFQYFKLKYLSGKNRNYIGYIVNYSKRSSYLQIPEIGALNNAGVLEEVKEIKYDEYFLELLQQFYSEEVLKSILQKIIRENNILCLNNQSNKELFSIIKENNQDLFKTFKADNRTYKENAYFYFRFFKLSDKYSPYESVLWESLKQEFGWRLQYDIVRG